MKKTKIQTENYKRNQILPALGYWVFSLNKINQALMFIAIYFCLCINIAYAQNNSVYYASQSGDSLNFTKLFDFERTISGCYPDEILKAGNFLYGVAGKLYKINTDGTGFTEIKLKDFVYLGGSGSYLGESFTISDTVLYGIIHDIYGYGEIYSVSVNGFGYKKIYSFTDENLPQYTLVAAGNFIYGIKYGQFTGLSYFFKIKPDGSGFQKFQSVGDFPYGKVLIEDNYIYGTTVGPTGSTNNLGTVYKVKSDGTDFSEIHRFANAGEGDAPTSYLTAIGSDLYGSTVRGGANDCGIIFKINKDGTNFKVLHNFTYEGRGGILVYSGNSFYGAAYSGGNLYNGTLFSINPDGSGFRKLHDFQGVDGRRPRDLVISGDTIWGITMYGGLNDNGTIFSYVIDKPQITTGESLKIFTLSITKPEKINLKTKKDIKIDKGSLIDLDTTYTAEGTISYTHYWKVKTGDDFQEVNNTLNINQDSTFYLFVITDQGCTFTDSVTVQVKNTFGIQDRYTNKKQIVIRPNPNPGMFQIEISEGNANYEYDIFDILGRKIANGNIFCQANGCIRSIKLDNIKPGVYSLVIREGAVFIGQKKLIISSL